MVRLSDVRPSKLALIESMALAGVFFFYDVRSQGH